MEREANVWAPPQENLERILLPVEAEFVGAVSESRVRTVGDAHVRAAHWRGDLTLWEGLRTTTPLEVVMVTVRAGELVSERSGLVERGPVAQTFATLTVDAVVLWRTWQPPIFLDATESAFGRTQDIVEALAANRGVPPSSRQPLPVACLGTARVPAGVRPRWSSLIAQPLVALAARHVAVGLGAMFWLSGMATVLFAVLGFALLAACSAVLTGLMWSATKWLERAPVTARASVEFRVDGDRLRISWRGCECLAPLDTVRLDAGGTLWVQAAAVLESVWAPGLRSLIDDAVEATSSDQVATAPR